MKDPDDNKRVSQFELRKRLIPQRLRELFHVKRFASELDEELRFDFERRVAANLAAGMTREAAEISAKREFGSVDLAKEECRDERGTRWLEDLWQDIRFGLRMVRKNPKFSAVVIFILAIGIGSSTTLFSIADASLRKDPDWYRDGAVIGRHPQQDARVFHFSIPEYVEMTNLPDIFERTGALRWSNSALTVGEYPERVGCAHVSEGVIPATGLDAVLLGRNFRDEEDRPGGPQVAILSYELWQDRFEGDPQILGKHMKLDGNDYTIVGVAKQYESIFGSGVMVPLQADLSDPDRSVRDLWVLVTLRKGVTWEQADVRLNSVAREVQQKYGAAHPEYTGLQLQYWNIYVAVTVGVQPVFKLLLGAVGLLLLICCANVANLLLARTATRKKEFVLRVALGAGRGRVVRQMLTENLMLAGAAATLGILIAIWSLPFVVHLIPESWMSTQPERIAVNFRILLGAIGVSALAGIFFAAFPAWKASRENAAETLKAGSSKMSGDRGGRLVRNALMISEIALAFVFLAGAALMIQSYRNLEQVDLGFRPEQLLTMQISLPATKYPGPAQISTFFEKAAERVSDLPGVSGVGFVTGLPMVDRTVDVTTQDFTIEGRPLENGATLANANYRVVSPGYFDVMGARLIRGRLLTSQDRAGSQLTMVINETMARRYWRDSDPVGKRIHLATHSAEAGNSGGAARDATVTIVGVVSDIKQIRVIDAPVRQEFYLPVSEFGGQARGMSLMVRGSRDAAALTSAIRQSIASIDSGEPIYDVETMDQVVADSFGPKRIATVLLGFFAIVALILSTVGIYAIVSYSVSQRTNEIGIRRALGAQTGDILKLVLWQGARITLLAISIGIVMAIVLNRVGAGLRYGTATTALLYEVNPLDPATFAAVGSLLLIVALAACWIPARRATQVEPMKALNCE